MTTWIKDMATWAEAAGFGTVGTDLFYGALPDPASVPGSVMALIPYTGRGPELVFSGTTVAVASDYPRFAVQCRDAIDEYDAPSARAYAFYHYLSTLFGVSINGTHYKGFTILTTPAPIAGVKEETGRWIIGFNVEANRSP